ncbi:DUF2963 domain-containing protein [Candidatus Phytoplasma sp. AldY-WA1]|uniref:DUF2963 domain-containing protein n=1 Tax=Candidatus Phytoplasma sp. AldY-WA1 TaxID=2852100 RepID=UPI002A4E17BA|nr:DUF2963 domain-containing protein [Candidatus Phytoplasma sp. AldY-WA1]
MKFKKHTRKHGYKIIEEYNSNNQLIKQTTYYTDDKTIWYITEYNEHGKLIKETTYNFDGTINCIKEFNEDKKIIKKTCYYFNYKTI